LPADVEGFYRRATADVGRHASRLRRDVLGLLSVARKPLSLRELSGILGVRQRQVYEEGIRPVRPFLCGRGGYSCYHDRFRVFVRASRELLFEDELPEYHGLLARWLRRPESAGLDYRLGSLGYHLSQAGETARFEEVIDEAFLTDKARA